MFQAVDKHLSPIHTPVTPTNEDLLEDELNETVEDPPMFSDETPDFLLNYNDLPFKPNSQRLSLSAQFHDKKPNLTNYIPKSIKVTASQKISEKKSKWESEVERARQRIKELEADNKEDKPDDVIPPANNEFIQELTDKQIENEYPNQDQNEQNTQESNPSDIEATLLFLNNLKNVFDQSVSLFWALSTPETNNTHSTRNEAVLYQFQELFSHMKMNIDEILPDEESRRATESQERILEKYSNKLLDMVKDKLAKN